MAETIIWTAIPKNVSGSNFTVSAHVSFHLTGAGTTVSQFPNANGWSPATFNFTLSWQSTPTGPKTKLFSGTAGSQVTPGMWQQLFPSNGPVVPFDGSTNPSREVQTYSTGAIAGYVGGMQVANVTAGFEPYFPASQWYVNPAVQIADIFFDRVHASPAGVEGAPLGPAALATMHASLAGQYYQTSKAARAQGKSPTDIPTLLYEAWSYFQPYQQPVPNQAGPYNFPKSVTPKMDFHQAIAMVGQHPLLMRQAGVVFDLTFPLPAGFTGGNGFISLDVQGMIAGATVSYPQTAVVITPTSIIAQTNPANPTVLMQGYLNMNDAMVFDFDVNSGAERLMDFAATMRQSVTTPAKSTAGTGQPLPNLRGSGIAVMQGNRQATTVNSRKRSEQIRAAGGNTILYVDDLFKGWRPDVGWGGQWYSLVARQSDFYYGASLTKIPGVLDETQISATLTSDPSQGTTGAQKQHETLFEWQGWSLAVGLPGLPSDDTNAGALSTSNRYTNFPAWLNQPGSTDQYYKLALNTIPPPKSLPKLRFAQWYIMRARAVDMAGNSPGVSDAVSPTLQPMVEKAIPYLRYDPIPAPTLHPVVANPSMPVLTQGNSAHVMVVHKYVNAFSNDTSETRWIAPPVGGVSLAEKHSLLDGAETTPKPVYAMIQGFDSAAPLTPFVGSTPPALPYLVDPAADGATLVVPYADVKGTAQNPKVLVGKYYGASNQWPNPGNLTIQIAPGTALSATRASNSLNVVLEPGRDITCTLTSNTKISYLTVFAMLWFLELTMEAEGKTLLTVIEAMEAKAAAPMKRVKEQPIGQLLKKIPIPKIGNPVARAEAEMVRMLLDGLNSTITPRKTVRMIHACQIPEDVPGSNFFNTLTLRRTPSSTQVAVNLIANVHTWSTGEIDLAVETLGLDGTPGEPVDYISEPIRITEKLDRSTYVYAEKIDSNPLQPVSKLTLASNYEFHDTKCHFLKVTATCKTRFRDYFPGNMPAGTPFTRNYSYTNAATANIAIVASSQRPSPAVVEYVIPSFLWVDSDTTTMSASARKGNLLRVYLRRPWFSSGVAETLGIVLLEDSDFLQKDQETFSEQHHTMIGGDPVFIAPGPLNQPSPSVFPTSGPMVRGVHIAESPQIMATVLPYEPIFDADRQMWFVDIDVDPMALGFNSRIYGEPAYAAPYTPFIRLVLARFQPFALNPSLGYFTGPEDGPNEIDLRLSPLTVCDLTQLQPDRIAMAVKTGNQASVSLSGVQGGTSYADNRAFGFLQMQVGNDPDAGWIDVVENGKIVWTEIPFTNAILPFTAPIPAPTGDQQIGKKKVVAKKTQTIVPDAKRPIPETRNLHQGIRSIDIPRLLLTPPSASGGVFTLGTQPGTYRIVVREYEVHGGNSNMPLFYEVGLTAPRLVYMDVLYL